MPVLWSPEELATRFAAYIAELHEFFNCHHLAHGSPEDIMTLAERLDAPGPFRDELHSMLRAIILRQGGIVPHTELLEILAIASGGTNIDPAAPEFQQGFRRLLSFVGSTVRRPWNEPPDAPAVTPQTTAERQTISERQTTAEAPATSEPKAEAPQEISKVVAFPGPNGWGKNGRKLPPPPPDDVGPDPSVAFAAAVAARHAAAAGAQSGAQIEEQAPPPEPPVAGVLVNQVREHDPPAVAAEVEPGVQADEVEAAAEPTARPSTKSFRQLMPRLNPSLHKLVMMSGGVIAAGLIVVLLLVHAHTPNPLQAQAAAPVLPAPQQQPVQPLAAQQAVPDHRVTAASPAAAKPSPYVDDDSSTQAPSRHRAADEDLVADPWTGPKPPSTASASTQSSAQPANPGGQTASQPSQSAVTTQASGEGPRPLGDSSGVRPVDQTFYRSGGADELPSRSGGPLSDHPGYLDVSSGVMASNLVSAPMPLYPTIAHLTHMQGEVILQAVIGKDGRVSATRVLSGHRLLRSAAVDAVKRWRYRPYRIDGRPVDVSTIVTVKFHDDH